MEDVNIQQDEITPEGEVVVTKQTEEVPEQSETPETTEQTTTEVEKVESTKDKLGKKKETFEERVERLKKEVNTLTGEKYKLKQEISEYQKKVKPVDTEKPKVPVITDFMDDTGGVKKDDYNNAMYDYYNNLETHKNAQRQYSDYEEKLKQEDIENKKAWSEVAVKAKEKYPDLDSIVTKNIYSENLTDALYMKARKDKVEGTTKSVDIAVYLGKNEHEAWRIGNLPPIEMFEELGRLEEKLENLTKNVSKAPDPIEPLDGEKGIMPEKELTDDEILDQYYKKLIEDQKKKYG